MIRITMDGHTHAFPVCDILRQFFGPVQVLDDHSIQVETDAWEGSIVSAVRQHEADCGSCMVSTALAAVGHDGASTTRLEHPEAVVTQKDAKREIKRQLYRVLSGWTGRTFPWGSLTGIRPTIVAGECLSESRGLRPEALAIMESRYGVDREKAILAIDTAAAEQRIQGQMPPDSVCVYVGIPFCPGRCAYCSFTLPECAVRMDLAPVYVDSLIKEARQVFEQLPLPAACIYVGGGTPTSLSAPLFEKMLTGVLEAIPRLPDCEITVEAGRPDTLDARKLQVMQALAVGRVCVNPQTMQDRTLRRIGRSHTVRQVEEAVRMVRESGIPILNMDLIAGLPGERPEDFSDSLRAVINFAPENVTIHALSMKRTSQLTGRMQTEGADKTGIGNLHLPDAIASGMVTEAGDVLASKGYKPYYLYRQKDSVGGLENTGYAQPGTECRYNVCMMGDRRSVVGLGSGSISKIVVGDRVNRIPTPKEIGQYLHRSEDAADRIIRGFLAHGQADRRSTT